MAGKCLPWRVPPAPGGTTHDIFYLEDTTKGYFSLSGRVPVEVGCGVASTLNIVNNTSKSIKR
jgi:hypothetical protein